MENCTIEILIIVIIICFLHELLMISQHNLQTVGLIIVNGREGLETH